MIRLIASDLDDTLLNEHGDVNPRVIEALRAAMAQGCGVVLASGRMLEAMTPLADRIGLHDPMLLYNGAVAYDPAKDETLFADKLPYDIALSIVEKCESQGVYVQAYPGRNYYCPQVTDATRRYAASIRVDPVPVNRPISQWMRENPCDMQKLLMILPTPEEADDMKARLVAAFPSGANFLKSRPHYVEVVPEGIDKGLSLIRLAKLLGVEPGEVMAFGDGQNDVSMISRAGTGVCMENGCPEARAAANIIAPRNTEDGVAAVIEDFLKRGEIGPYRR